MQQMTNILLSSADAASAKKTAVSAKPEPSAEGDNFSAALAKASKEGATTEQKTVDGNAALTTATTGEQKQGDLKDAKSNEESNSSDDVNQVLAQINLANNFPVSTDTHADSKIAADGEGLPLDEDTAAELVILKASAEETDNSDSDKSTALSDEILQALSLQTGISEQALSEMPEAELEALLAQSQILDADGKLLAQYAIVAAPSMVTTNTADGLNTAANKIDTASGSEVSNSANRGPKLVHNSAEADVLSQQAIDPNTKAESRDILGKEAAIQTGTATTNTTEAVSKRADIDNSNNGKLSNTAAAEQLKGAELSVRLTPIQMGLEANLASGNEEQSTQDIKTVSGLQAHNLQIQQSLTRVEPQQIQLALKQHADQATQMQEMIQRFSPVMKQQLMTMVSQGVQHAEIRLDPAELGSMMVRIQVQGDTTQVQFQVSQHQTRDLVEQAMPRLREMLAEQGMQLTDGQVSQGDRGNDQSFQGDRDSQGNSHSEMDEISAEELIVGANQATSSASGIDYYA
ncbi:flagellar hook-length control protein FliK [Shewanella kaireitica]|uniref:flagellar hook-length control protein FliK n=1 Tax=Shewanella kaireitica TaxID=212021 RepID=UPI00200CB4FF|nr:flagellar hook-length control protein FliK [Shewanella kaireitica]MCL1093764.1 flagellar hook-length control protein FliK [Shewanella kaireitica]